MKVIGNAGNFHYLSRANEHSPNDVSHGCGAFWEPGSSKTLVDLTFAYLLIAPDTGLGFCSLKASIFGHQARRDIPLVALLRALPQPQKLPSIFWRCQHAVTAQTVLLEFR